MWLLLLLLLLFVIGWWYLSTPEEQGRTRQRTRQRLEEKIKQTGEMSAKKIEIDVPQDKMHLVVGKGGETIKKIRSETKAKITLPEKGSSSTKVVIEGLG